MTHFKKYNNEIFQALRQNKENENISFFLKACEDYGLNKTDLFQVIILLPVNQLTTSGSLIDDFRSKLILFQTVDLVEAQNLAQVQTTLYKMGGQAQKVGFSGPVIGVKQADANKREFSQEQLDAGKNVIGLQVNSISDWLIGLQSIERSDWLISFQMGSNQQASQKGMTAYGLGRQIISQSQHES